MNLNVLLAAEILEVGDGEEADVRRVVPFIVQDTRGLRRPPRFRQHMPELVVSEVRNADYAGPADADHLGQHALNVPPRFRQHMPELVVSEVRNADYAGPADADHLGQHALNVLHRLQGLGQYHTVKLIGGEGAEALVQVRLDDVQAAADAGEDLLLI